MPVDLDRYEQPFSGRFDNGPRDYEHINAVPIASALGAEVRGVNVAELTDDAFGELAHALYTHKVICVRDQILSLEQQERFTQRFGEFGVDAYTAGLAGHEHVQRVVKEADERVPMVFGGAWHTDSAFLERPPSISMLYCVDAPSYGGDTWWANCALAHDYLSETLRHMITPLKIHMSARNVVAGVRGDAGNDAMNAVANELDHEQIMVKGILHPLVRRHPETGRRSLYVDQTYSVGIDGMNKHEAQMLIGFLLEHITQPVFTCRMRWQAGSLMLWDNRSTIHHAFNDYDGYRREMYRTIVQGERPQGVN